MLNPGYFPMGVGYRWVYVPSTGNGQDDVVFEVVGVEKIGRVECFVVLRTIGDHQIKFYVELNGRGVLIHQVGQDRYEPAYRQFAFYTKQGDHWDWKGTIGGEPSEYGCVNNGEQLVSVPFGQWDAFMVAQEAPEADAGDTEFWLADGIGVVRLKAKYRDKHDPPSQPSESPSFDWQLKEFSQPSS